MMTQPTDDYLAAEPPLLQGRGLMIDHLLALLLSRGVVRNVVGGGVKSGGGCILARSGTLTSGKCPKCER